MNTLTSFSELLRSTSSSNTAVSVNSQKYDNAGAINTLQFMMNGHMKIHAKAYTSKKDNTPRLWVESRDVAPFSVIVNQNSLIEILRYFITGEVIKTDINPEEYEPLPEGDDFALTLVKMFVDNGVTIQWTPLFRTVDNYISGVANFSYGKLYFSVPRTNETLEYLLENKQCIC